jgi:hypothetical protein
METGFEMAFSQADIAMPHWKAMLEFVQTGRA